MYVSPCIQYHSTYNTLYKTPCILPLIYHPVYTYYILCVNQCLNVNDFLISGGH